MHAWTNMVGACIYIFERSIRLSENRHRSRAAPIPCDVSSLLLLLLPSDLCFTGTEILAPFSQIPSPKKPFNRVPRSGSRRRYFQRKGNERSIEISSRRRAKERRIWMARTFLTEGIESPVLGPAQAKKERARAPTPPRFQQRSTLFSLFPPFFPLSRASLVVAPPRLRLASIGQAAIGPWTQSFTENVECRRSRDSSTGARERERERESEEDQGYELAMAPSGEPPLPFLYHYRGMQVSPPSMSTNLDEKTIVARQ